jgi:hypothetical protein
MSTELNKRLSKYSIKAMDGYFLVLDCMGERVTTCPTEEAARQEIAECEIDDMLWHEAKSLVEAAAESMMQKHKLDRKTAEYWIGDAAEMVC